MKTLSINPNHFQFLMNGHRQVLLLTDIMYLEADTNYTIIYTTTHRKIVVARTLKMYEILLRQHSNFLRISKTYLVNMQYAQHLHWHRQHKEIRLSNGIHLPIARRRAMGLKDKLRGWLEG